MREGIGDTFDPRAPLRVAEGLDVLFIGRDEVLVQFGTRSRPSELLRDSNLSGVLASVLRPLVEGASSLQELLEGLPTELRGEAVAVVEDLADLGILTEVGKSAVEQYLRYTFEGNTDLDQRSVALIGAGPVGARIAAAMLQQGIGNLTILDDRHVDRLWSEFLPLWPAQDRGAEGSAGPALVERLQQAGYGGVRALAAAADAAGIGSCLDQAELAVVALERPNPRLVHLVNRQCISRSMPWMLAGIDGNFGLVGPLFVPVETACYNDYSVLATAAGEGSRMARRYRRSLLEHREDGFFPGLPGYAELVAGWTVLAAVHYLLTGTSWAVGRALFIDFDRMHMDTEDVLKLPRCPVCGTERPAYQPPFPAEVVTPLREPSP